jgi:hypothetical protein
MSKASELATLAKAGTRALASDWAHWALGGMAAPPECGAPRRVSCASSRTLGVASCGVRKAARHIAHAGGAGVAESHTLLVARTLLALKMKRVRVERDVDLRHAKVDFA